MAALKSHQRRLLENRNELLSELKSDIVGILLDRKVLTPREVDDIEIGRTQRERNESLLDVLHYKDERDFREFCFKLRDSYPELADHLTEKEPRGDRFDRSYESRNSKGRYSSPYPERERSYRETNGTDINENYKRSEEREERNMRGDEPIYTKPVKGRRERDSRGPDRRDRDVRDESYRSRSRPDEEERSHSSYHERPERESDRHSSHSHDSVERAPSRKSMDFVNAAENYIMEKQTICLEKAHADQGFGIAVSGGRDNPHQKTGDTSIVVSDIVKGSPADGLLRVNDVIVEVNSVNVEGVPHGKAVQALKDSGLAARLIIKRRKPMPRTNLPVTVTLHRTEGKGYGFSLANRLYVKEVVTGGCAFSEGEIDPGDVIMKINDKKADTMNLREAVDEVKNSKDKVELVIIKPKGENLSLSTRSLPSQFRRGKAIVNGVDNKSDHASDRAKSEERGTAEKPPSVKGEEAPIPRSASPKPVSVGRGSSERSSRRSLGRPGERRRDRSPGGRSRDRSPGGRSRDRSPGGRSLDRSRDRPLRGRSPGARSRDRSPGARSRDRSPGARSRDRSPGARSRDRSPGRKSLDRPRDRPLRGRSPGGRSRDRSPGGRSRDRSRERPRRGRSPGGRSRDRSPGGRSRDRSPGRRSRDGSRERPKRDMSPGRRSRDRSRERPRARPDEKGEQNGPEEGPSRVETERLDWQGEGKHAEGHNGERADEGPTEEPQEVSERERVERREYVEKTERSVVEIHMTNQESVPPALDEPSPVKEELFVKLEAKKEEWAPPDLPPRRYSDQEDNFMIQSSWKSPGLSRDEDREREEEREREEREREEREREERKRREWDDKERREREDREKEEREQREKEVRERLERDERIRREREENDRRERERCERDERERRDREERVRRDREERVRRDREEGDRHDRDEKERRDRDEKERRDRDEKERRDRDEKERRDQDRRDRDWEQPRPAEVSRSHGQLNLSMDSWEASTPARKPDRDRHEDYLRDKDTRTIQFNRMSKGIGIQVQGGNKHGIFVAGVRDGNPAHREGLRRGDKILMANDIDFKDITREEAVLILLSLAERVCLLIQPRQHEFNRILEEDGDDFFIKVHFDYKGLEEGELNFRREDVLHVCDTMNKGTIGSWRASLVDPHDPSRIGPHGVIPNKCRAEQLATVRIVEEDKTPKKENIYNSLKRRASLKRKSKSTTELDSEDFVHTARDLKLPAYERVQPKRINIIRPCVLLGALADIAVDRLLADHPELFGIPTAFGGVISTDRQTPNKAKRRTLSYSSIRAVVDKRQHCLLDIAPEECAKLNYCQLYPIVIFIDTPNKNAIKELRSSVSQAKEPAKNVNRLFSHSEKVKKNYAHLFSATVYATTDPDIKYRWTSDIVNRVREEQEKKVWAAESEFDEGEGLEFHRHSMYDYESNLDSPTTRSSVSHPPEDDLPPEPFSSQSYNGPQVEYRVQDGYEERYSEDSLERKRGYKPHGNVVKVLPSSQKPEDLRQSLRKTRQDDYGDDLRDSYNATEQEIQDAAGNLRRVAPKSDLLNQYDERAGVNVSQLWEIDNESRNRKMDRPVEIIPVESAPAFESAPVMPVRRDYKPEIIRSRRNIVIDKTNNTETEASRAVYPNRSYAQVRQVKAIPYRTTVEVPISTTRVDQRRDYVAPRGVYTAKPYGSSTTDLPPHPSEPIDYKLSRRQPHEEPRLVPYKTSQQQSEPDDFRECENGEHDTQEVVATARGVFTSDGGCLESKTTGVSIVIPPGAIPYGVQQEIYFKVCKDREVEPPLDKEKGETLLSPLVMCGPHGLKFQRPVELHLPHCAHRPPGGDNDVGWSFALKSSDAPSGTDTAWENLNLNQKPITNEVTVEVDHFSMFTIAGTAQYGATKRMVAGVFALPPRANSDWTFRVVVTDDLQSAYQEIHQTESSLGRVQYSCFVPITMHGDARDVRVQLRDFSDGWLARSACKKYIDFQSSWNAYEETPSVDFVVRDVSRGGVPRVCGVEVWQEGHERESVLLDVTTAALEAQPSKSRSLQEYLM